MQTTLHKPASYVLANADSALVWQVSHLPNGSMNIAFSASDDLNDLALENIRQFESGEMVNLPRGKAVIERASLSIYKHGLRSYYHVTYKCKSITVPNSSFYFTELELLDYDNPKNPYATDFYRAFDYLNRHGDLFADGAEELANA